MYEAKKLEENMVLCCAVLCCAVAQPAGEPAIGRMLTIAEKFRMAPYSLNESLPCPDMVATQRSRPLALVIHLSNTEGTPYLSDQI